MALLYAALQLMMFKAFLRGQEQEFRGDSTRRVAELAYSVHYSLALRRFEQATQCICKVIHRLIHDSEQHSV